MADKSERQQAAGRPFFLRVRRCLLCGRILTSEEAVRRGYGCRCAEKKALEDRPDILDDGIPGQISIEEYLRIINEAEGG